MPGGYCEIGPCSEATIHGVWGTNAPSIASRPSKPTATGVPCRTSDHAVIAFVDASMVRSETNDEVVRYTTNSTPNTTPKSRRLLQSTANRWSISRCDAADDDWTGESVATKHLSAHPPPT